MTSVEASSLTAPWRIGIDVGGSGIKAAAVDTATGTLVDPFDGQRDLAAKLLRAVGRPEERFAEDGLRCLRAARFVARGEHHLDQFHVAALVPLGLAQSTPLRTDGVRFVVVPRIARVVRVTTPENRRHQPGLMGSLGEPIPVARGTSAWI